jgi:Cu2+-containing amine oxidase
MDVASLQQCAGRTAAAPPHPLDPLSSPEVAAAAAACRARAAAAAPRLPPLRFNTITLQEPPKADLLRFTNGRGPRPPRRAFCILQTPPIFGAIEATVDLSHFRAAGAAAAAVVSWVAVSAGRMYGSGLHAWEWGPWLCASGAAWRGGRPIITPADTG